MCVLGRLPLCECVCAHMCVCLGWVHPNSASEFPTIIYTKFNMASSGPSCSKSPDASRPDTKVAKKQPLTVVHLESPEELEGTSHGAKSSLPGLSFPT